jgi:hypothetical protein
MSDWARKKPELWMEKLLIWRGVEERGERDRVCSYFCVVLVCSIVLHLLLSSKRLPEMEADEVTMKEQIFSGVFQTSCSIAE